MKKEIIFSVIGIVLVVVATVFYARQYKANIENLDFPQNTAFQNETGSNLVSQPMGKNTETPTLSLTLSEVSKHNTVSDCWMIVSGKVYSVASYATAHPGGARAITSFCGKDGTVAFDTKGGNGSHSQNAVNILSNYYVGDLGAQTSTASIQTTEQKIQQQTLPAGSGREDDEYDD